MPSKKSKQVSFKATSSQLPEPFTQATEAIEPFLGQLDPSKVYITHVDRHKADYKKFIFTLAVSVNTAVLALLLWRVYIAVPKYLALVQTIFGYVSSATVDTAKTTRREQIWILLRRTLMLLIDYLLYRFVWPWPASFFFELPANPITWRWRIGFQAQEVIVRVCRNWGADDLIKGEKRGADSPFFKTRIEPAIAKEVMYKTGYLMMDGSWDLDFALMQDAHTLVKEDKIKMEDLDMWVLVHQEGSGWLAWQFGVIAKETEEEDNAKKMIAFKNVLTKMGKESLFWKWQEIVEEERNADGGFTAQTQERIQLRTAKVFEKNGVDFHEAMEGVGQMKAPQIGGS